jgi:hypothetical protein
MHNSHSHCQVAQANTQTKLGLYCVCSITKLTNKQHEKTEDQYTKAVWRNGGFSASYNSFVVGLSAVLRLNFCAKNPPLRQAPNLYNRL